MTDEPSELRSTLLWLAIVIAAAVTAGVIVLLVGDDAVSTNEQRVSYDIVTSRYEYEPGTEPALEAPLGSLVTLRVSSADVTHGFAIEGYPVNEEIPAGQSIEIQFRANEAGTFRIYCTVFCGAGHPQHKGTLHVV